MDAAQGWSVHLSVEQLELEFWAAELRAIAGLTDDDLLLGPEIAVRIVGEENVLIVPGTGAARLEGRRILVPIDHEDFNFAFAHELAEIVLEERTHFAGTHEAKERAANYVGAALLTPPTVVRRAHKHFGERVTPIAEVFGVSKTLIRFRLGEVLGLECGLVTSENHHLLLRNPDRIDWTDPEIKDFALKRGRYADGKTRYRGLAKTYLRGGIDEGRVALRVTLKK